jgi:hypothetical protein
MLIPPRLSVDVSGFYSVASKLSNSKVQDWKHVIPQLSSSLALETADPAETHCDELQSVLDILSPIKSPIKSMGEVFPAGQEVADSGYTFTNELLGEGISQVKLAQHSKTGQMVLFCQFTHISRLPSRSCRNPKWTSKQHIILQEN